MHRGPCERCPHNALPVFQPQTAPCSQGATPLAVAMSKNQSLEQLIRAMSN
jgi:hypothetical protein